MPFAVFYCFALIKINKMCIWLAIEREKERHTREKRGKRILMHV